MLILKTIALEPMHGYGVALRIEQTGNGVFRYPIRALWSLGYGVPATKEAKALSASASRTS